MTATMGEPVTKKPKADEGGEKVSEHLYNYPAVFLRNWYYYFRIYWYLVLM